jgi:hypothetical protein
VLHKPSLKKELRRVRDGWTKPKVQPILFGAICSVLLHDGSFGFVQRLVGDLECVRVMFEGSPPHLFFYTYFIQQKETMVETNKGSPGLNTGELKSFYYYYCLLIIVYIFKCSPNILLLFLVLAQARLK